MNTKLHNPTQASLPYRLAALRLAAIVVTVMLIASAGVRAVAAEPPSPFDSNRTEPLVAVRDLRAEPGSGDKDGRSSRPGRPGRPGHGPDRRPGNVQPPGPKPVHGSDSSDSAETDEPREIEEIVASARASSEFVAEIIADELASSGLATTSLAVGTRIETDRFVAATALNAHGELASMFDQSNARLFVRPPSYEEPIIVLEDELLVDRRVDFELAPGACRSAPAAIDDLCFTVDPTAAIPSGVAAGLRETRKRLASGRDDTVIAAGVTVADAERMSDTDLLDLMLNAGPRSIRRLSIVPLAEDRRRVDAVDTYSAPGRLAPATSGVAHVDTGAGGPRPFETEYFLTGDTKTRRYDDKWSFEKDAWWHPRIYLSFSYLFEVGFGVRAPFSVDVGYVSGGVGETTMSIEVDPVSLETAVANVGLPADKYFDGDEFVLFVNVDCTLTASLAGIGGSLNCDDLHSIDTSFSRDFDPVIGDETRTIHDWWLWEDEEESPLRFEVAGGAAWAELDLGVGADVENGRFGVGIDPLPNTVLPGVSDGLTWFGDRSARPVVVDRQSFVRGSGFELNDPRYAFDIALRPKVKFTAGIDVKVYENDWSFVWPLDFLGFSMGFELDHHPGTVESHSYALKWGFENPFEIEDWEMAPVEHATGNRSTPTEGRVGPRDADGTKTAPSVGGAVLPGRTTTTRFDPTWFGGR